jgi:hypothetical protein
MELTRSLAGNEPGAVLAYAVRQLRQRYRREELKRLYRLIEFDPDGSYPCPPAPAAYGEELISSRLSRFQELYRLPSLYSQEPAPEVH